MIDEPTTIGDRIARLRRARNVTQEDLAERAGVSVEVIRKLEQGDRTSARMTTLAKLARALTVPTTSLIGDAAQAAAQRDPDEDDLALLDVRRALTPARGLAGIIGPDPRTEPASLPDVRSTVRLVDGLYHCDEYAAVLRALPPLLADARDLASHAGDDQQRAAAADQLAAAYRLTGKTLLQIRRLDLAHTALTAGLDAAQDSTDPAGIGAGVVRTMCWLLLRQSRFAEAERLAIQTADAVEPRISRATPAELATWGWLLLYGSAAAARDNRPDDAQTMLDSAAAAAARMGEHPPAAGLDTEMGGFSPTKVAMSRVEVAVVAGDPAHALAISRQIEPSPEVTPSCRHRHQLDIAWSLVESGRHGKASEVLLHVGTTAPHWLRQQRYARDLVDTISTSRRRVTEDKIATLTALIGTGA